MPEIIPNHVPRPRTLLAWDGIAYRPVSIDAAGNLQIDVLSTAMDPLAATAANQATMITALQLIDDLRGALRSVNTDAILIAARDNVGAVRDLLMDAARHLQVDVISNANLDDALQSVATDRLQVRGEDQMFSVDEVVAIHTSGVVSGAGGFIDSPAVPVGRYWIITTVTAWDQTTALTEIGIDNRHGGVGVTIHQERRALATWEMAKWSGHTYLDVGDTIRCGFVGSLAGDTVGVNITGYQMTVE